MSQTDNIRYARIIPCDVKHPCEFKPPFNKIVVRKPSISRKSAGGIVLTDLTREMAQQNLTEGIIIARGPDVVDYMKVGDRVLFSQYAGGYVYSLETEEIEDEFGNMRKENIRYDIMYDVDVWCIVESMEDSDGG